MLQCVKLKRCGPCISTHPLPLDGELAFYLRIIYFLENDLESPLIFVLFLKGKQNKKENYKCDSLFWKKWYVKNQIGFEGQATYQKGTVTTVAPSKSLKLGLY